MTEGNDFHYVGTELEIFAGAARWKARLMREIRPYLGSEVLEVGAGLGATAKALASGVHQRWVLLEPDATLALTARASVESGYLPPYCTVRVGDLSDVSPLDTFDSVLYVDVLEHIDQDAAELARASSHLKPGGHLVVLSPAHMWLYSQYDASIGHFRRYNRRSLRDVGPPGLTLKRLRNLDAAGVVASLGNRLLLRQVMPSRQQVQFWDRTLVPLSRILDPMLGFRIGRSILAVWQREAG